MTYPLVRMSCTGNQMTKDGIQQLLSNNYQRRDHTSSETKDNVVYRKTQVHLNPYTPEKKIEPPELYKKDKEQSLDNYQCVNNEQSLDNNPSIKINQRPKHYIILPNRLVYNNVYVL